MPLLALVPLTAPVGAVARRPATTRRARESYHFVSFLRRPDVNFC